MLQHLLLEVGFDFDVLNFCFDVVGALLVCLNIAVELRELLLSGHLLLLLLDLVLDSLEFLLRLLEARLELRIDDPLFSNLHFVQVAFEELVDVGVELVLDVSHLGLGLDDLFVVWVVRVARTMLTLLCF